MRIILIDQASGYVFADSADFEGKVFNVPYPEYASVFAKAVDTKVLRQEERDYSLGSAVGDNGGYVVFEADEQCELVPVITDGQSQAQIDAVLMHGRYVGFLKVRRAA